MFDDTWGFVSRAFLRSVYDTELKVYIAERRDEALLRRLNDWSRRSQLTETQDEGPFTQTFFVETWGYGASGRVPADEQTLIPKFRIANEGPGGGSGEADLALGWFGGRVDAIPQAVCEFKDIRSNLDAKQNRKGSYLTPVEQCLGYLRGARRSLFGNEPVQPWWALVTDMNEFRLYWWDRAPNQYLRFIIRRPDLLAGPYDLLAEHEDARFDRFLFWKLFHRDMLLSQAGKPALLRLIEKQWIREKSLEKEFYNQYKAVRERLFKALMINNQRFRERPVELLRLTQKLLDRFIFAFYCEDMGERMLFPPQFIREYLQTRSSEPYYEQNGTEIWTFFRRLFEHMNTGGVLGTRTVPEINGGLFAPDPEIDALDIRNYVFAAPGQGVNEASLESDPRTIFYLSARYNYAARGEARESISLYTLGRIFEQSITELEYRAGELENRETIAKLSKRKRDGVYYTPEWIVNLLVEGTLSPWFADARIHSGYPQDRNAPSPEAVRRYVERLRNIRIIDPACGSGAFLIAAFRRLLQERIAAEGAGATREPALIAEILANNIYGVDINPAAVEIAKLALWLHSARAEAKLSSLDHTIRCGNSLVAPDFWRSREPDEALAERVNSFDWREAFPEIWRAGRSGFDIVVGNPPYVKLQNLMKVDSDVVAYLQANRTVDTYASAQTGHFDLYLPFIEKGLRLLASGGRMAYIAPSLWSVNEYGEGLRTLIERKQHLERWIDFKSFQVFDEAITYTALQFFTREPQASVKVALAPEGEAADVDWTDDRLDVPAADLFADMPWLMATGPERRLIKRLARDCLRLDDPRMTSGIIVGIQTSADRIYHLERLGDGLYHSKGKPPFEVRIEDAIMKPLASGSEAKRYEEPETNTYLLFPYERDERAGVTLLTHENLESRYPQAWRYLKSSEKVLRAREDRKMDVREWWAYNYPKNLDKQDIQKLIVAQTVPEMRVCADASGTMYLNTAHTGCAPGESRRHCRSRSGLAGPVDAATRPAAGRRGPVVGSAARAPP